ncbi:hypothetical protein V1520DRAFT_227398 [Lipomyces starkeyi]|uniref:Uncharacterized protein n=1 Tax=Lipomyces starkeyi NRRL Y-11557 TaxID=675824 RepID=A0A1E3PVK0_LIPST|nr:hypothetical protein LIPSTDRAFT_187367 [Lipomyces starkeyi NRRL Y-11557]
MYYDDNDLLGQDRQQLPHSYRSPDLRNERVVFAACFNDINPGRTAHGSAICFCVNRDSNTTTIASVSISRHQLYVLLRVAPMKTVFWLILTIVLAKARAYDILYYSDDFCQVPLYDCWAIDPNSCCGPAEAGSVYFNCNPDDEWWVYYGGSCAYDYGYGIGPACFSGSAGVTGAKYSLSPYKLRTRDSATVNGTTSPIPRKKGVITESDLQKSKPTH